MKPIADLTGRGWVTKKRNPEKPSTDKAPNLAAEQGRADSATNTLAPKVEKPAPRKARQAWSGKYDDLGKPATGAPP
jgi:hypothetical protein